jgi:hypothetical protein
LGFTLFTVGITTGFLIAQRFDWMQATWSIAVWYVYGGILMARVRHAVAAKWVALAEGRGSKVRLMQEYQDIHDNEKNKHSANKHSANEF